MQFLQVARLYRKSLKVLSSWAIDRDIINEEATKIRARFDAERGCKPEKALRLMRVSNLYLDKKQRLVDSYPWSLFHFRFYDLT